MLESKVLIPPPTNDTSTASETSATLVALNGNPFFVTLATDVANLQAKYDAYMAVYPLAKDGTKAQKIIKNEAKAAIRVAIKTIVKGVNEVAPNDRAKQATTALPLNKIIREPRVMADIKKLTATAGNLPGSIVVKVEKGANTVSVVYEYTTDAFPGATSVWMSCGSVEGECIITGLTSATIIWVRAYALGRRRQLRYTDPIRVVVN